MALPEEHFKKILQSTEPACCDEKLKEDIMKRIMDQNKKIKNNHKKITQFCFRTSVFLALSFLGFFVQDIGCNLSPEVQEILLFRTVMALIFILTIYIILEAYNRLSKDF